MKVLLVANYPFYLYNFRLPLLKHIEDEGHELLLVTSEDEYYYKLKHKSFRCKAIPIERHGLNPFKELRTLCALTYIYRQEKPDLVHHFTVKGVLYGSIAARLTGIKAVVNAITGGISSLSIDQVYMQKEDLRAKGVRFVVKALYQLVLRNTHIIFQNSEHQHAFLDMGLVSPEQTHVIRSSGVDVDKFCPPSTERTGISIVVLAGRMLWTKGIGTFVEAVRVLREKDLMVRFVLVGDTDPSNPGGISEEQLHAWEREDLLEWWGFREDMADIFASSDIVCLPSFGEALPKTLIEAAACGRPLIATDVTGCREVVQHNENGFLVPQNNVGELASALRLLIEHPEKRRRMGRQSRKIAVREFSADRIARETLSIYQAL